MLNSSAERESRLSVAPARHRIFETGLGPATLRDLRQVVGKTLGRRAPLAEGGRDVKWWVNLADLSASYGERPIVHVFNLLAATPMMAWCREQMGDDLVAVLTYCIFRRFDPSWNPIPAHWHFDANIFGVDVPIVNLWMPLVDVGETAPGLSLVDAPRRPAALWSRMGKIAAARGGQFDAEARRLALFSDADVTTAMQADPEARVITPRLKAGGAIAFDQQYLHGTQEVEPGMGARDSFEFRVMHFDVAMKAELDKKFKLARIPRPAQ